MQQEGRAVRPGSVHEHLLGTTANVLLCVLLHSEQDNLL